MFKSFWIRAVVFLSLGAFSWLAIESKPSSFALELSSQKETTLSKVRADLEETCDTNSEVLSLYDQLVVLIASEMDKEDQEKLGQAILFAAKKHQGKNRQHSHQEPYICYPLTVTHTMMLEGKVRDVDVLIAAVLHDTAPNKEVAVLQEIESVFGSKVAHLVEELSAYPVSAKKQKQDALLSHAQDQSELAAQVQLGVLLYSVQELIDNPPAQWTQEQKDHYVAFAEAVMQKLPESQPAMGQALESSIQLYWKESRA